MGMKLEELLKFEDIVIQCHDNPDADAIASGYGIYTYLKAHGKEPRLIYGGRFAIQKSNLVLLTETFAIPIQHVKELEEPELLLTVDCCPGQGNVQAFSGETLAVIDHHQVMDEEALPRLQEIHSNYGACATIVWKMLEEAGYSVNENRQLATALYYGLYMDTNKLQEISHPMDKDMRDGLRIDRSAVIHFQNSNLSLEELEIASEALADYQYHEQWKFALVEARPCDPNILGIISDMLIEVDVIDTCIAYCMLNGNAKISVRSCVKETRADELAGFVSAGLGSSGGHIMKAGGFLDGRRLAEACEKGNEAEENISRSVRGLLYSRMEKYFQNQIIIDTDSYEPELSGMKLYQKKPVPVGYVEAESLFPAGTEIQIRMLEGDIEIVVDPELCIMIGVDGEIYPSRREKFRKNYDARKEPYTFVGEYPPTVRNTLTGESRKLTDKARVCVSRDTSQVYAQEIRQRTKVFTAWDKSKYMLGEAGDWFVVRKDDKKDMYIVKKDIFARTYQEVDE